jgi:hypothetical protein
VFNSVFILGVLNIDADFDIEIGKCALDWGRQHSKNKVRVISILFGMVYHEYLKQI